MTNYNKIVKSTHGKKSYKVLLKQAKADVKYHTTQVLKYEAKGDLHYLTNARESLESAQKAVEYFENKLKS